MKTVTIPVSTLETLIEGLECAINVCYNVDSGSGDCSKSYPYATGYSRSAMESTVNRLKTLNSQIN